MTPLEKALQEQDEIDYCDECEHIRIVKGYAFCGISGKLLHPLMLKANRGQGCGPARRCKRRKENKSMILIDMNMPKEPDEMIEIAIFGDGKVLQTGESWRSPENGKCYYTTTTPEKHFQAVELPPHGRLIDADALKQNTYEIYDPMGIIEAVPVDVIDNAPTVIPEEEGE